MKKYLLSLAALLFVFQLHGQHFINQNKVWAFGSNAGVDFATGSPVAISTNINTNEGCASVSNQVGRLLFYTDGSTVYNRLGAIMPLGASIVPYSNVSSTQGTLIVPSLTNFDQYYVFSLEDYAGSFGYSHLSYSIVDTTLAGGLGDLVPGSIGVPITSGLSEKMIAVASDHCSIWVLTHAKDFGEFYAYEISSAGLNTTPVISTVGTFSGPEAYTIGMMKASPDRRKIVCNSYIVGSIQGSELYDFDPATGIVSNCQVLNTTAPFYGAEFSPDNTKLYSMDVTSSGALLAQYDITLPTTAAIIASRINVHSSPSLGTDLKLGPDGRIYTNAPGGFTGQLDCITSPNTAGVACNYVSNAVSLAPNTGIFGLPNMVVSVVPDTFYARFDTTACIPPVSGITIASHHTGTSYLWNDGTTAATNNVLIYGTYWVATTNGCSIYIDTIVVNSLPSDPPPVISGKKAYCFGDPFIPLTVSGSGILWYTSATSTTGSTVAPIINTSIPGTYVFYASQTVNCESSRDSIVIKVKPRIRPDFTFYVHIDCNGGLVDFTNTTTNANSYLWDFGDGSPVRDTNIIGTSHLYTVEGTYYVKLTADSGVCSRDTTIEVAINHIFNAAFSTSPDTICAGESISFNDLSTPAGTFASYVWKPGDGSTDVTLGSITHTYNAPGIYPVTLYATDTVGCIDSMTKKVFVLQVSIKSFHDTIICIGQPLSLTNTVSLSPFLALNDYTYQWSMPEGLDDASVKVPHFSGTAVTVYTLTATLNPYNCTASDTFRIRPLPPLPVMNITPTTTIVYGQSIQLNADSMIYYYWKPNDGSLDNPSISNPVARPNQTTTYVVYGYDINGCEDSAQVTVIVDSTMNETIPTGFTPNGDGMNDIFRPTGIRFQSMIEFRVFNRWGQQMFYSTNYKNGWDGTYNGIPQDLGVYSYIMIVAKPGGEGENIVYKGDVTLIR